MGTEGAGNGGVASLQQAMRTILRTLADIAPALLPIGCALIVMTAALVLHGALSRSDGQCCGSADVAIPPPALERMPLPRNLAPDLYARRIHYVAALQFQVATIVAALLCGTVLAWPRLRGYEHRARRLFLAGIIALGAFFAIATINEATSPTLHSLMERTVLREFMAIEPMRYAFEQATSITATFLIGIASLFLLPVRGDLETRIRETASRDAGLSYLLGAGTALLAADVLLKMCAGRWAAAYYVKPEGEAVKALVDGIVSGWAVYDSLVLAAAYIPAAVVLRTRLRREAVDVDPKAPPTWFDPRWLTVSPAQEISKVLAILAPFLVGQAQDIANLLS